MNARVAHHDLNPCYERDYRYSRNQTPALSYRAVHAIGSDIDAWCLTHHDYGLFRGNDLVVEYFSSCRVYYRTAAAATIALPQQHTRASAGSTSR